MTPEDMALKAQKLFNEGFHCSQAVFAVGAEKIGLPDDRAQLVIASLAPFGGGLGSSGDVCGSLPGALAAIGVLTGKKEPSARDHRDMWRLSARMVKAFDEITARYGGIHCRDIARVDWRDREQVKAFRSDPSSGPRRECIKVIGETARALGVILEGLSPEENRAR
ncbi:MAG: C-GCAxxG-C-C family protein [Deltaproteobacteria bacterium]